MDNAQKLKERLGWWEHGGKADISELVDAIMSLCDIVSSQKHEIEVLKEEMKEKVTAEWEF